MLLFSILDNINAKLQILLLKFETLKLNI